MYILGLREDVEQHKRQMNGILKQRDAMREDIKSQSSSVQEADREANLMRK